SLANVLARQPPGVTESFCGKPRSGGWIEAGPRRLRARAIAQQVLPGKGQAGRPPYCPCRQYMQLGRLVPAGSVNWQPPVASSVTVPMSVQAVRFCEERTLYVWPGWPMTLKTTELPATV